MSLALAVAYIGAGRARDAVPLARRALELRTEVFGAGEAQTLYFFDVLADAYEALGQLADACRCAASHWPCTWPAWPRAPSPSSPPIV